MSLGFPEILVICVVALLVLGPDKLPGAMRTVGRFMHDMRNFEEMVRREVDNALRDASTPAYRDGAVTSDPTPPPPPPAEQFVDDHPAPPEPDAELANEATDETSAVPEATTAPELPLEPASDTPLDSPPESAS